MQVQDESETPNFDQASSLSIFCSTQEENQLLESENPFDNEALQMEEFSLQEPDDFNTNGEEEEEEEEEEAGEEEVEGIFSDDPVIDCENMKGLGELKEEEEEETNPENKEVADSGESFAANEDRKSQSESIFNLNLDQEEKVRVESCGAPISQFQNQPTFQITKDGKMTLFGKETQTINLMRNGKQSAILLLTNGGELSRNFLKLNQNGILVKGLKTLPIVTAPDK